MTVSESMHENLSLVSVSEYNHSLVKGFKPIAHIDQLISETSVNNPISHIHCHALTQLAWPVRPGSHAHL